MSVVGSGPRGQGKCWALVGSGGGGLFDVLGSDKHNAEASTACLVAVRPIVMTCRVPGCHHHRPRRGRRARLGLRRRRRRQRRAGCQEGERFAHTVCSKTLLVLCFVCHVR